MLALFRLSQFVRSKILPSQATDIPLQADANSSGDLAVGDMVQLGRLLCVKLKDVPEGAVPVNHDAPVEFHTPDGVYSLRAVSDDVASAKTPQRIDLP